MRRVLSVAILALGAGSGLGQGVPGPSAPAGPAPSTAVVEPGSDLAFPNGTLPASHPAEPVQEGLFGPVDDPGTFAARPRGPAGRFWLRGEYLLWWTKGSQSPPLITSGLPGTTSLPGALGQTGTSVIYGNSSDGDNRPRSGGRFTAGLWLDPCRGFGLDGSFFFLASRTTRFDAASDARLGSPFIARPFFDVLTGTQNSQLVAFPALAGGSNVLTAGGAGLASGDIHASSYSRLWGADVNAFCCVCSGCNYWLQSLVGFRYLNLEEGIAISETTRVNPALPAGSPFFGGSTISISDKFDTRNNFYGGQVGLRGEARWGRLFVQGQGKVALGVTNQVVDVHGSTAITPPGGVTAVTPVGFLASGGNGGHFVRDRFSVVPEVGIIGGYQVTNYLRAFVGYNFLYWSSVVRPADQIDLGLSGTHIPTDTRYNPAAGPARPGVLLHDSGFWVQGISFGAEVLF